MDYSLITEQSINNRYNTIPSEVREVLDAAQTQNTIQSVSKANYLDEEKALMLEQLVSLTLLGFLSPEELVHELREQLFLNNEHSRILADELNTKIFAPIKDELIAAYNPLRGGEEQNEGQTQEPPAQERAETLTIAPIKIIAEDVSPSAPATTIEIKDGGPAILQKQSSFFERAEPKQSERKPFFSFGRPASSGTEGAPRVRATVETPFGAPHKPAEEMKKVVHYSEMRTPVDATEPAPALDMLHIEALKNISLEKETVTPAPMPRIEMKTGEKKSSLFPDIPPLQTTIPNIPMQEQGPKPIDAIIVDHTPAPVTVAPETPTPTNPSDVSPALQGNVIHLR